MKIVSMICKFIVLVSLSLSIQVIAQETEAKSPNFLLLIGDDMGIETLSCFEIGNDVAFTPNLDQLCAQGKRFNNFWAQPVCSPTRASLLTGQYGFRNGVGTPASTPTGIDWNTPVDTSGIAIIGEPRNGAPAGMGAGMGAAMGGGMGAMGAGGQPASRPSIRADAFTMLNALKADDTKGYATAAVGKWHLANDANGGLNHPQRVGFDYYAGEFASAPRSYYGWSKVINGADPVGTTIYATTENVNEGIAWLKQRGTEPWFLWMAFNAPHTPIQLPPKALLKSEQSLGLNPQGGPDADGHAYYNAMIEAMDTEIGRLLNSIDDETLANTYIIFMGDNGTENDFIRPPFYDGNSKGTVYQGGVSVPFFIMGPGVEENTSTNAMGNVADMFATVMDLAGISFQVPEGTTLDSISLASVILGEEESVRDYNYADRFGATRTGSADEKAIRNEQYKLVQNVVADTEEFYDLVDDPYERKNLLVKELASDPRSNYEQLKQRLDVLLSSK